jgi:hypothetical protein
MGRNRLSGLLVVLPIVLIVAVFTPIIIASPSPEATSGVSFLAQPVTAPNFLMQIEPNQFLMRNGTWAAPGVVFTPLNGYIGNVTLDASVTPVRPSGPTVFFNSRTVKLNATLPGSPFYSMIVNTTSLTELGLYTITVTGSSSTVSHSTTATVGVTSNFVPGNGADLLYKARFMGAAYVGATTVLNSTFENLGYVPIGIQSMTVIFGYGDTQVDRFDWTCTGTPPVTACVRSWLNVNPYEQNTATLTIHIPETVNPGNYTVTVHVGWVLHPGSIYEQLAPVIIAQGYLMVYPNPPHPSPSTQSSVNEPLKVLIAALGELGKIATVLLPIMSGVGVIVILVVGLVIGLARGKEKKRQTASHLL